MNSPQTIYSSHPKVIALRDALYDRDPFYSGICTIPDYQRPLYYTFDNIPCCIDLSKAEADDLEALYRACEPAEFGRNGDNVLDESYRKAGKMDLTSFATLFDPRALGIHEQVSRSLLTKTFAAMDVELYKLNVYGKGDFFKAHKDTPRGQGMFGSLVVVFPTMHEGGQFVLREEEKEWTLDFSNRFASATEPSVCFVAFYGDIEHEVLPVTSGYRVTLTYNLYHNPALPLASSIPTPFHLELKRALVDLVNDKSTLCEGGYLGFGLTHEYVHTGRNILGPLLHQLKGSDRALADVCDELGLDYSFRLFYRSFLREAFNLISTKELCRKGLNLDYGAYKDSIERFGEGLTIDELEGVIVIGKLPKFDPKLLNEGNYPWMRRFHRTPVTKVLEVTRMKSSLKYKAAYIPHGNQAELNYFYGTACMLITVRPAESRNVIEM